MAWVFGVPAALFVLVLLLERLEDRLVARDDRAERIRRLMLSDLSDAEVTRAVAALLEPALRHSPFDPPHVSNLHGVGMPETASS